MAESEKKNGIAMRTLDHSADDAVKEVQSTTLAEALLQAKPKPLSSRMLQLYFCLLIATFCSCINGYDGSVMGGINRYEAYRRYFGFDVDKGTPATGIVYAIYTIGNLVGSFVAGPATDFRGEIVID